MQNTTIKKKYSVIILAAGKSSRMGVPKWSLQFDKNRSFIENIVNEYHSFGCKEIVIVINETDYSSFIEKNYKFPENVRIIINCHPDWHRFYSLKLGVKEIPNSHFLYIHNVDNPFVNHDLLYNLLENSLESDLIVPEYKGRGGHPILITKRIITDIISETSEQIHFKEFLTRYSRKKTDVNDMRILININTIEDYKLYF
ncbi:MAG: hypothetical protein A2X13_07325 [Bacteroidetes bacterium GWC2_33_15]|nr:MAG: hypothetical protein A2X10_01180 [Bacteroidetes bacterium GWA2_33_15]OFX48599.1 MAG: hypothetical protein A2X13_07325 [Bacteroidetes bacterium GWC2_33_15]OFX64573.1 MAG: hypothetical protein A2X15_04915 [Bacteroidetes bacterium GWB2_32_14]OFX68009.1 MAG: hypothetical protein A2X14_01860 [Bacteroidetes bacterium GWD2_33_33]HAN18245.1 hypothetical protein [Bacteroidales bacterium]